ncbi:hypothetical protein AGMMS49965_18960 [Bacteroidia bacterium]|nr:hypothetical protein AGMMS49965_18960 [Bacteroidia bacterium]
MMKIDLVYLWVDGSDPQWVARKNAFFGNTVVPDTGVHCKGRFFNNGELKYSLRSMEKYAPWINKVFVVTDGQIPDWLELSNPKIQIVDHTEIMPKEALPCYNPLLIEHFLYKIEGLSEYFLFANDDMFFNADVQPDFFFAKDGCPIVRLKYKMFAKIKRRKYEPTRGQSILNAAYLVEKRFGKFYLEDAHHNIDAYRKSDCRDVVEKIFKEEIAQTIEHHIRSPKDIQRIIYSYYALAVKHARLRYVGFVGRKESCVIGVCKTDYDHYFRCYRIKLFCMNDGESETDSDRMRAKAFLEKHFPDKSSFEK